MTAATPFLDRPEQATERLVLRCPDARDIDAIVAIVGDFEVARCLSRVPHPYDAADAWFFLQHVVPAEWVWAITLRGSERLVGVVGLTPEADLNRAELGYWLARPYWGRGIATEAARAVLAFGFDTLNLSLVTSGYFQTNPASGRVLDKLGFVAVSAGLRPCLAAGRDVPSIDMQRSRS